MTELTSETGLRTVYRASSGGAVGKDIAQIGKHFAHVIRLTIDAGLDFDSKNNLY